MKNTKRQISPPSSSSSSLSFASLFLSHLSQSRPLPNQWIRYSSVTDAPSPTPFPHVQNHNNSSDSSNLSQDKSSLEWGSVILLVWIGFIGLFCITRALQKICSRRPHRHEGQVSPANPQESRQSQQHRRRRPSRQSLKQMNAMSPEERQQYIAKTLQTQVVSSFTNGVSTTGEHNIKDKENNMDNNNKEHVSSSHNNQPFEEGRRRRSSSNRASFLLRSSLAAMGPKNRRRSSHHDDAATCAICLCEYQEGEVVAQSPACSHMFHHECMVEWLMTHDECPCCRKHYLSSSSSSFTRVPPAEGEEEGNNEQEADNGTHQYRENDVETPVAAAASGNDNDLEVAI